MRKLPIKSVLNEEFRDHSCSHWEITLPLKKQPPLQLSHPSWELLVPISEGAWQAKWLCEKVPNQNYFEEFRDHSCSHWEITLPLKKQPPLQLSHPSWELLVPISEGAWQAKWLCEKVPNQNYFEEFRDHSCSHWEITLPLKKQHPLQLSHPSWELLVPISEAWQAKWLCEKVPNQNLF